MPSIGLVADDLTGACDSALQFLGAGAVRVGLWPCVPGPEAACAAVSTESREAPGEVAYRRSHEAAARLGARDLVYRKLDSLLRGHVREDLRAALDALPGPCLVAPALPAEGRGTRGGVQRWPGGAADLRRLLEPLPERLELRDAESDADLDAVAREALERGLRLVAGSAGLAEALARELELPPAPPARSPGCRRPLAVVGSPAAAGQAAYAVARGWEVAVVDPGGLPELAGHDGLVLTGGETAARVLGAHGAQGLELEGEAIPRAPLARVRGGSLHGLPVVLKAGAFGPEDALHRALEVLRGAA